MPVDTIPRTLMEIRIADRLRRMDVHNRQEFLTALLEMERQWAAHLAAHGQDTIRDRERIAGGSRFQEGLRYRFDRWMQLTGASPLVTHEQERQEQRSLMEEAERSDYTDPQMIEHFLSRICALEKRLADLKAKLSVLSLSSVDLDQ